MLVCAVASQNGGRCSPDVGCGSKHSGARPSVVQHLQLPSNLLGLESLTFSYKVLAWSSCV